jgi:hypothetical protein
MSPQNPFDNPKLLIKLAQAFESVWLVMRAHEPLLDAERAKELSMRSVGSSSSLRLMV